MIALLLSACRSPTEDPPVLDAERDPEQPSTVALSWDSGVRGPQVAPGRPVPTFPDALRGLCAGSKPPRAPASGTLARATLEGSVARCNDGSPPVLYVRAATDPAHQNDWVVHLEGGASCKSFEDCAGRWCGTGPTYDASDMSSLWAHPLKQVSGLLGRDERNRFRDWNVVQLAYCSSDYWLGTAQSALLIASAPPGGQPSLAYTLPFQGDAILDEALDALSVGVISDDGAQILPPLPQAETLLFGGSSAGAHGALLQLGEVAERFPDADVIGLVDAAAGLSFSLMDDPVAEQVAAAVRAEWEARAAVWGAVTDASCLAATPEDERWRCFDLDHVLRHFVSVPVVIHYDLFDNVLGPFFFEAGMDEQAFYEANLATLREYSKRPDTSVHVTGCGHHMSVTRNPTFLTMDVDGLTMEEATMALIEGESLSALDDRFGRGSHCP